MATASIFEKLVKLKSGTTRSPILYNIDDANTKPPYTVTVSNNVPYIYKTVSTTASSITALNLDSPLWIIKNNVFAGKFGEAHSAQSSTYMKCVELANGNYVSARYLGPNAIQMRFYRADNTPASGEMGIYRNDDDGTMYRGISLFKNDDNGTVFASMVTANRYHNWANQWSFTISDIGTSINGFNWVLDSVIDSDDPYATASEPIGTGGFGSYDYGDGDDIPAPTKPSISASDSGFVTLFKPTLTELQDLADYMWAGLFDFSNWRKLFADPMDCIIALNIVPVLPTTSGTRELKVGNIGTGKQFSVISEQFVEVNCGSITVNGKTASNLDYSPYTSASIFLPFIGERQLDVDDIMDSTLTLTYIIDLFSGACTANIVCSKQTVKSWNKAYNKSRLLYSFSGNCACNVPITNASYNSVLSTLVTAVGVGATAIATHGGSLAGGAGIAQAGALVQSVANEKPVISKSGNMAGASGFMGARTPYLIMKFPNQCRPNNVNKEIGQPSYLRGTLSSFSGFTKVHETFLTDMPCTETEKNEIDRLLKEGVIV